jgi:energy-coupling factor transporter ATP-binding protein EcfA2
MVSQTERERDNPVREVDWKLFIRDWKLKAGDHVTIIGPTGSGKTTLAMHLLGKQPRVTMFATKRTDVFYDELIRRGWTRIKRWPKAIEDDSKGRRRLLLWLPTVTPAAVPKAREVFKEALDKVAVDPTHWTVFVDELLFASSPKWLDLGNHLELAWQQFRSSKHSLFVCAQRSSQIPLLAYDQIEYLLTSRENDLRNADRIGEMCGLDRFLVRDVVRDLDRFQWLCINVRNGKLVTFTPDKIV